jgi:hypothetical protein
MALIERFKNAWNAFRWNENNTPQVAYGSGSYGGYRPDRTRLRFSNERSIVSSIFTRISVDVAAIAIRHIRLDEQGRYTEDISSELNSV